MQSVRCAGLPETRAVAACLALGACIVGVAAPRAARGQTTPETSETRIVTAIVVTARRIEEDVQDVPLSVQSLSGDFLDDADLTRLYELQFSIPGLVVNNIGLFGARFTLRGIAAQGGSDQSIALHLNGVYLGDANLAIARSFDLERIEVLKGPQGALYGRNATGGSIDFITRAPQDKFSAEIEAAYGTFATKRAEGYLNLPVQDTAVRLAFVASEGDGYIRNSVDHRRFAEADFWGLRASFASDIGDRLRLSLMAQRIKDDGASGDLWTPNPEFLPDPSDIRLTTVTLPNPYLENESDNVDLTLEYDLAIGTLRSVTGYARSHTENNDDCAGIPPLEGCVRGGTLDFDQWSEELQLHFSGTGPVEGLVGINYFEAEHADVLHQHLPLIAPPVSEVSNAKDRSAAIFGQSTLHFGQRWAVTGGLRWDWEAGRVSSEIVEHQAEPTFFSGDYDADKLSWRLDLEYAFSDHVMLYAAVSTGYKSGGVSPELSTGGLDEFGPENLLAYEVGEKSRWLDGRLTLNAAAFFYDFEDLQVTTITLAGSEIANAAKAELYGLDADGRFDISHRFSVSGGVVWMPKREFVEFTDDGVSYAGKELVRAPEWSTSAAITYEVPVMERGDFSARLEYSYRSSYFFTRENLTVFEQDGFGLLNLLLKFESNRGWYVFASGRNLRSQDYFHQIFLQSSPGYPDTYEIGAGYRF